MAKTRVRQDQYLETALDPQFAHFLMLVHPARLSELAKLAELSNREELYRPKKARQYRYSGRKYRSHKDLLTLRGKRPQIFSSP
jgi:hypothetical protein